jgi:hypothetical protein
MKSALFTILASTICAVVVATAPVEATERVPECNPGANLFCSISASDCESWSPEDICVSIMLNFLRCGGSVYDAGECEWAGGCASEEKLMCYWSPIG